MSDLLALEGAKRKLNILVVNTRGMNVELREDIDVEVINKSTQPISQQSLRRFDRLLEAKLEQPDSDKQLWQYVYRYILGVRLLERDNDTQLDNEEQPLLVVSAEFCATYLSHEQLSADEASAFAQDNALYHIWPYWREFVQSVSCRIGLQRPINIPTFKLSQAEAGSQNQQAPHERV